MQQRSYEKRMENKWKIGGYMRSSINGKTPIDRYKILIGIMIIVFVSIVARLVYLQVFNYEEF